MDKWVLIVSSVILITFVGVIAYQEDEINKNKDEVNRLEIRNERLQDENSSLRDQVWNLNRYLMERGAEDE